MPRKKIEDLTSDKPIVMEKFEQAVKTLRKNAKSFDEVYPDAKPTMINNLKSLLCKHQNQADNNSVIKCLDCNQTLN